MEKDKAEALAKKDSESDEKTRKLLSKCTTSSAS